MTPELCRGARAILDWSQEHLAEATGLSRATIRDYENGKRGTTKANQMLLGRAFFEGGLEFTGGDEAPGIRVLKPEILTRGADKPE